MRPPGWLIWLLALGRMGRNSHHEDGERLVEAGEPEPRSELLVIVLLLLCALCAAAFVVFYAVHSSTQVLGGTLAGALALLALALIIGSKRLIVTEHLPEEYPEPHPEAQEDVAEIVEQSGSRITRKRLLGAAGAVAGGSLGVAFLAPAVSLGPVFDTSPLYRTTWARGRRVVDTDGKPMLAKDIEQDVFYTGFPEGASKEDISSPIVIVRVDPADLRLPPGRQGWAPEGILAYSKICTHAGCAIALYRAPLYPQAEPKPALVCPCHYSTFDPATGASVKFGPAGRPLPQLPLAIDTSGVLIAGGTYSDAVGPSWWGVHLYPPHSS
jgi:ubiquinol-cytochrome c reductase iron-sulfur subunit